MTRTEHIFDGRLSIRRGQDQNAIIYDCRDSTWSFAVKPNLIHSRVKYCIRQTPFSDLKIFFRIFSAIGISIEKRKRVKNWRLGWFANFGNVIKSSNLAWALSNTLIVETFAKFANFGHFCESLSREKFKITHSRNFASFSIRESLSSKISKIFSENVFFPSVKIFDCNCL